MMHTSLMPALAAFFAGPTAQTRHSCESRNPASSGAKKTREIPALAGMAMKRGILAELREAGCHD